MKLVIGNRNYSSWSLRAWLFMKESGLDFDEVRLPMFTDAWYREVTQFSPAGRVPVLIDGDSRVWDSMAIILYLREKYSQLVGWPEEPVARAHAQSISAEMHSGFIAIRGELPQNIRKREVIPISRLTTGCRQQIDRVLDIWKDCRTQYSAEGPWLFGKFTIADVMYAPVALRFQTYGIEADGDAGDFVAAVSELDSIKIWSKASAAETEAIEFIDCLTPAADSPLTLG